MLFRSAGSDIERQARLAEELARQGRPEEAEKILTQALQKAPDHMDLKNSLAVLRWSQGLRSEAVSILRGILNQEPWHRAANWNLGQFLKEVGLDQEARQVYEAYIQNNPGESGMAGELRRWNSGN